MPYKNEEDRKKRVKVLRDKCKKLDICINEGCNKKSFGKVRCEECRISNNKARSEWGKSIEGRFSHNKSRVIRRGGIWQLTLEEYKVLASQTCIYCDGPIEGSGSGLDQIIPRGGYIIGNVVPCCYVCNRIKVDIFTYQEIMELKQFLVKFRLVRNGRWPKCQGPNNAKVKMNLKT